MDPAAVLDSLRRETREELDRILAYWSTVAVDPRHGGFHGYIGPDGVAGPGAAKGAILNTRILWTFSAAYGVLDAPWLAPLADRAAGVVLGRLMDPVHGGVYWMLDAAGHRLDDRKHIYAQAFALYALAEHHRATGQRDSLEAAIGLFDLIEEHAADAVHGGYLEAFDRDWRRRYDDRLSEVDLDAPKSENTHLHLLEAYTTLVRAWADPRPRSRLRSLVTVFVDRIVDADRGHTRPFFDRDWTVRSTTVSFGHDIETAWLLADAVEALDDSTLAARVRDVSLRLVDTVLREGLDPDGGVYYEVDADGVIDRQKEWWTQAEAIVGFLYAYGATGRPELLAAARDTWGFVTSHMIDRERGEWHRRTDRDGTPQPGHEKAGPWKGPYHNARACLEVMARAAALRAAGPSGAGQTQTDQGSSR